MNRILAFLACWLALVVGPGCQSNPDRTHDAGLLDDKVIVDRVADALSRNGAPLRAVRVESNHGVVTLRGTVQTWQQRQKAESLASHVDNVTRVENEIEVGR